MNLFTVRGSKAGAALAILALAVAACGGTSAIDVDGAWARTSPMMTSAGAVYMEITATDTDSIIAASVDSSIAGTVELHEVVAADGGDDMGDMDEGDMGGEMTMQQVNAIDLPADETVTLEPGGYHIMLLDLVDPLETGQTFEVTLQFSTADDLTVEVEVMENAP